MLLRVSGVAAVAAFFLRERSIGSAAIMYARDGDRIFGDRRWHIVGLAGKGVFDITIVALDSRHVAYRAVAYRAW